MQWIMLQMQVAFPLLLAFPALLAPSGLVHLFRILCDFFCAKRRFHGLLIRLRGDWGVRILRRLLQKRSNLCDFVDEKDGHDVFGSSVTSFVLGNTLAFGVYLFATECLTHVLISTVIFPVAPILDFLQRCSALQQIQHLLVSGTPCSLDHEAGMVNGGLPIGVPDIHLPSRI